MFSYRNKPMCDNLQLESRLWHISQLFNYQRLNQVSQRLPQKSSLKYVHPNPWPGDQRGHIVRLGRRVQGPSWSSGGEEAQAPPMEALPTSWKLEKCLSQDSGVLPILADQNGVNLSLIVASFILQWPKAHAKHGHAFGKDKFHQPSKWSPRWRNSGLLLGSREGLFPHVMQEASFH